MPDWGAQSPDWLIRLATDGALASLYILPNVIGLVVFAWAGFWLIDRVTTAIRRPVARRVIHRVATSGDGVGALRGRLWALSLRLPAWLLKLYLGLPTFYVFELLMSANEADQILVRSMAGRYAWQARVFENGLPVQEAWDLSAGGGQQVTGALIVGVVLFEFFYWRDGFDVTRKTRRVGDELLRLVSDDPKHPPRMEAALGKLRKSGWTLAQCESAYWFLMLVNFRPKVRTEAFEQMSPSVYGAFRAVGSVGGALGLAVLHPILAGLYFAAAGGGDRETFSARLRYHRHFQTLPGPVRSAVVSRHGPV